MGIGIKPIGEMVLLAMENAPEKTESGLLLPEEAREKMNVGLVEAVGPQTSLERMAGRFNLYINIGITALSLCE